MPAAAHWSSMAWSSAPGWRRAEFTPPASASWLPEMSPGPGVATSSDWLVSSSWLAMSQAPVSTWVNWVSASSSSSAENSPWPNTAGISATPATVGGATLTLPSTQITAWPHSSARITRKSQSLTWCCTTCWCLRLVAVTSAVSPAFRPISCSITSESLTSLKLRERRPRVMRNTGSRSSTVSREPPRWPTSMRWRTTSPLNSVLSSEE
ncbi:hypothetical protein D9M71_246560 [compost metagenome]